MANHDQADLCSLPHGDLAVRSCPVLLPLHALEAASRPFCCTWSVICICHFDVPIRISGRLPLLGCSTALTTLHDLDLRTVSIRCTLCNLCQAIEAYDT